MAKSSKEKLPLQATKTLKDLIRFLESLQIPFCLIGGASLGHYKLGRFTKDLDFKLSISESSWPKLKAALESSVHISHLKISFIADPNLPDLVRMNWGDYPVDLLMANTDYQQEVIRNAHKGTVEDIEVPVASPEDLIILKLIADRPQDRVDVGLLFENVPNLDLAYIRQWCKVWEVEERLNQLIP